MNAGRLIDFMRRLVKDTNRKVFLILDNLRVHYAKKVRAWLKKHKEEIEVFYLPPYAPEYNPDELLNSDLKHCYIPFLQPLLLQFSELPCGEFEIVIIHITGQFLRTGNSAYFIKQIYALGIYIFQHRRQFIEQCQHLAGV